MTLLAIAVAGPAGSACARRRRTKGRIDHYTCASLDSDNHRVCAFAVAGELLAPLRKNNQIVLVLQVADPARTTWCFEVAMGSWLGYPVPVALTRFPQNSYM
jgi:hypothetical protein